MKIRRFLRILPAMVVMVSACSKNEITENGGNTIEVIDYMPAPGQFINEGMTAATHAEAVAWAQERMDKGLFVSLGSFGGYITVKSHEAVANRRGYDFGIAGNAFEGSSEPGIVWVSADDNGNGKADDTWYELKGSDDPRRNYSVTYTRTEEPGDVRWSDNLGGSGVIAYLPQYHAQNYYPAWVKEGSYTLAGSRLEPRTEQDGNNWVNNAYAWGYADNMGSDIEVSSQGAYRYNRFDLDNAVDAGGQPVTLDAIRFVKVQSAILHNVPEIGEVSTEVCGFKLF